MTRHATKTVLGPKAFAAITAVEGLALSSASKRRLASLHASDLSDDERRAEIIRAYRTTQLLPSNAA
jgi:hypothetical protein